MDLYHFWSGVEVVNVLNDHSSFLFISSDLPTSLSPLLRLVSSSTLSGSLVTFTPSLPVLSYTDLSYLHRRR